MLSAALRNAPWQARLMLGGAALAIFFSAFEVRAPAFSLGPVSFTVSELAVFFFFFTAAIWAATDTGWFFSRRSLDLAVFLFVVSNFASVPVAGDRGSAFKFALRMAFAALVFVGVSRLPSRTRSHLVVAGTISVTIMVVTIIGLLENFTFIWVGPKLLSPWQEGTFSFGPFYNVRISSTLPFPTVLSMYLELAMPIFLTLGLWLTARTDMNPRRRFWLNLALVVGLAAMTIVLILTYTRTALMVIPASMLAGALLAYIYRFGRRAVIYFLLVVAMLGMVLGVSAALGNKMSARLGVAPAVRLYTADYALLNIPTEMKPDQEYTAHVRLSNTSDGNWEKSGDDFIAYTFAWLTYPEKEKQETRRKTTYLPSDIAPGETVEMDVAFFTPATPGRYVLVIEPFGNHVSTFSAADTPPLAIPLELGGGLARRFEIPEPAAEFGEGMPAKTTPERDVLWRAAWEMWQEHPILGVGTGQFRKVYPEYANDVAPDERLETHNIFLESLANTGIVGLGVMLFMLVTAMLCQFRLVRIRSFEESMRLLSLGLLVAMVAYISHGILDFFLWQNGVTFLFFALLGLTGWLVKMEQAGDKA